MPIKAVGCTGNTRGPIRVGGLRHTRWGGGRLADRTVGGVALGGLEGPFKSAPTVERATMRSAPSDGHESRNR